MRLRGRSAPSARASATMETRLQDNSSVGRGYPPPRRAVADHLPFLNGNIIIDLKQPRAAPGEANIVRAFAGEDPVAEIRHRADRMDIDLVEYADHWPTAKELNEIRLVLPVRRSDASQNLMLS